MSFNESNTVEAFIRDRLVGSAGQAPVAPGLARQGGAISGIGWHFIGPAELPRQPQEALVEPWLRDALIRLNPDIAANPDSVDDVLYRLARNCHERALGRAGEGQRGVRCSANAPCPSGRMANM